MSYKTRHEVADLLRAEIAERVEQKGITSPHSGYIAALFDTSEYGIGELEGMRDGIQKLAHCVVGILIALVERGVIQEDDAISVLFDYGTLVSGTDND